MVSTPAGSPSEGIVVCMGTGECAGVVARVVRKDWKRWQEREILGYVQRNESGRLGRYSFGFMG
mgnify:CR=1 FL=1